MYDDDFDNMGGMEEYDSDGNRNGNDFRPQLRSIFSNREREDHTTIVGTKLHGTKFSNGYDECSKEVSAKPAFCCPKESYLPIIHH